MATNKTLTTTNVTIAIPAFSDAPDQRVNSNCIDKIADAVNALPMIKTTTIEMTESGSTLRLDNKGIAVGKFIRAIVRGTNNIGCIPYSYSTAYYVKFINTDTLQLTSGQYSVDVMYWE